MGDFISSRRRSVAWTSATVPRSMSRAHYPRTLRSPIPRCTRSVRQLAYAEVLYRRPSRYCPTDRIQGFAISEFGFAGDGFARVQAIVDWIRQRIEYLPGSGTVRDSAEDTLLDREWGPVGILLTSVSPFAGQSVYLLALRLSMPRASRRWTFMRSSKLVRRTGGVLLTQLALPPVKRWFGSSRAATLRMLHLHR